MIRIRSFVCLLAGTGGALAFAGCTGAGAPGFIDNHTHFNRAVIHVQVLGGPEPARRMADLVVVDGNPLEVPPAELKDLRVELTVVGGRIVHDLLGVW